MYDKHHRCVYCGASINIGWEGFLTIGVILGMVALCLGFFASWSQAGAFGLCTIGFMTAQFVMDHFGRQSELRKLVLELEQKNDKLRNQVFSGIGICTDYVTRSHINAKDKS